MGFGDSLGHAANDLLNSVNDAVRSGDFSHLSSDINQSLRDIQYGVKDEVEKTGQQFKTKINESNSKNNNNGFFGNFYQKIINRKEYETAFTKKLKKNNIQQSYFGVFIAILIFSVLFAVFFIVLSAESHNLFYLIGTAICTGIGLFFIKPAITKFKKAKEYDNAYELYLRYRGYLGKDEYITIDELQVKTRESPEQIISEIKEMMKEGLLPKAVLDEDETVLILSENAYRYYMDYMKEHAAERAQKKKQQVSDEQLPEEAKEVIAQGEKYIADFHHLNDIIPDESLSEKLDKLESIIRKIFAEVRRRPQKAPDLHRLLDYYLPTTKKLVQAYADAENNPDTANISQIKSEIESSLDMINGACEKIFDQMFSEDAMDISSDINVMKQMMEQDGLVNDQMKG
ncbi:MAG: 5-bromo-4-chloroindolyl phosphate hydrolysis family protein [Lachnospiraceae bacterium]|nr:5-bromo-4-chloroindolyl phosphate hydrolysis family protein [Lachnospiraceae bacterium]MDD7665462.1 5-bromo-4-chloroindolyl phosphate hydrolysis family protein [Lachnospiraceae bacterium]MDY4164774.1 5-bromo-4-chloroindolyl phosphate hydrolysis family protein [Lachnospiraceae bacterium]